MTCTTGGTWHLALCDVKPQSINWLAINPLNAELNPICCLLALLGAHHFLHVSRIGVKLLTHRLLMPYIYMKHLFLMFLDHTQRRTTVGRTPLDEWSARRRDLYLTTHDTHRSGRGLCDELITHPEESYRLCCVVVCDLETPRMGAPYIYDISSLRVKEKFLSDMWVNMVHVLTNEWNLWANSNLP